MANEQEVIEVLFKYDVLNGQDSIVEGIAKLARNKGYSALSAKQKAVLEPLMSCSCDGAVNPGGHHNGCTDVLIEDELINAYHGSFEYGGMMCVNCQSEIEEYRRQWDRISKE